MNIDMHLGNKLTHVVKNEIEKWHNDVVYMKDGTQTSIDETFKPHRLTVFTDENEVIIEMRYG